MLGLQVSVPFPVVRWQGHSPNVLRRIKLDSTAKRVRGIGVDDPGASPFVRQVGVNGDSPSDAQPNRRCDQCSAKTDSDGLALTERAASVVPYRDYHFQGDAVTSSRLVKRPSGGHAPKDSSVTSR